jgi:class 3 adenylate cyclase
LGDHRWRETLSDFHHLVRRELAGYRGQERTSMGDGFLASFDGPGRAIRCASAITQAAPSLGLQVRAGVHTGECDLLGDDLAGIAVHIGARIADLAGSDEVLVSSTVKDLVAGSGLQFEDRGRRTLRGVPGFWRLWRVAQPSG